MSGITSERRWLIGGAAIALLIVLIGWAFFISPQREETSSVEGQTADAQLQNITLQGRINLLRTADKQRAAFAASLAQNRRALPSQPAIPAFLRSVQSIAAATDTKVTALGIGEAQAITPTVAAASPGTTTPGTTTPSDAPVAAMPPAAGGSGVFSIPIDATVIGAPGNLDKFVVKLQTGQPRAVLISAISEGSGDGVIIKMTVFYASSTTASAAPSTAPSPGG